ncbi:MAG: ABC transporter substrate-binding protein [Promethearchaeota archaeon]
MEMEKKNLAIIILAVVLAASGVGNVIMAAMLGLIRAPPTFEVLKLARTANPVTMDPCDTWDSVSNDILDQVVETLIAYNLSDPEFPLVGRLAESWNWPDETTVVFHLRPNVLFHDGTALTGECVLHTIERINFFGNATGTLTAPHHMAFPHSLYKFAGAGPYVAPIFNHTLSSVNPSDPLEVTVKLNSPFAPAEGLLAYTASSIVHPDSTPVNDMLELGTDLAIGTGPFKLVSYVPNSEVRFERWDRYWDDPAYWDELVYVYYRDAVTANNAMLAGDIDYLGQGIAALKEYFEASPYITVTGDGVHDYINGSIYWYIAFNSPYINVTWRKAIASAFNYTYLNREIDEGTTVKANSLVPPGFPAHNYTVKGGVYNIPYARQKMQSMGYGVGWEVGSQVGGVFTGGADEALWKAASFVPDVGNFTNGFNFRHRQGSHFMELLIQRFEYDMDLIGVEINIQILTWDEFIEMGENHPDRLHIYYVGWGPDYFETFNMIDPLVNPASSSNFARINNPQVNIYLALAAAETDTATRYSYYEKLQYLIMDKYQFHMGLQYDLLYHVHAATLKGVPYNTMRNLYWYPTYREVAE